MYYHRRQSLTVSVLDVSSPGHDDQSVEVNHGIFKEGGLYAADATTSPVLKRSAMPELRNEVIKLQRLGSVASILVFVAGHARSLKLFSIKEVALCKQSGHMIRAEILALEHQQKSLINGKLADEKRASPFIVEYYGYSEDYERNVVHIAVEFVGGGNMQDWITHNIPAPEPWLKSVIFQSLKALSALHASGHHHLDVKPANILITQDGDVKLADFGLSASGSEGGMLGTRRYMAPERLSGHAPGPEADIWSLGVVLISAAFGQDFFHQAEEAFGQLLETDQVAEKLAKIKEENALSPNLLDFTSKCLALHPHNRPSISELLSHPWLEGHDQWRTTCKEEVLTKIASHHRTLWVDSNTVVEDIVSARKDMVKQSSLELETTSMPITLQMVEPLSNELNLPASQLFDAIVANEKDLHSKCEENPYKAQSCEESLKQRPSLLLDQSPAAKARESRHEVMSSNCNDSSDSATVSSHSSVNSSQDQNQNQMILDPMILARIMETDLPLTRPCRFKFCQLRIFQFWKRHFHCRRCFTGEDAVKWLIEMGYAKDETDALNIGNSMIEVGAVFHIRW